MCEKLICPSDSSLFIFYLASALFMFVGFASIICLAGEIVNKDTFSKKNKEEENV